MGLAVATRPDKGRGTATASPRPPTVAPFRQPNEVPEHKLRAMTPQLEVATSPLAAVPEVGKPIPFCRPIVCPPSTQVLVDRPRGDVSIGRYDVARPRPIGPKRNVGKPLQPVNMAFISAVAEPQVEVRLFVSSAIAIDISVVGCTSRPPLTRA